MQLRVRRLAGALLTATLGAGLALTASAPASAITGGTDDSTGKYPDVGLIAFYDGTGRYRCSATLVTPTVLVTAAHCTDGTKGKTAVTFSPFLAAAPPSGLPVASDPAKGYTAVEITKGGYLSGTAYTHPKYSDFTDLANWNDVGVVVLDKAVRITPATLAPVGTLDRLPQAAFTKTLFRQIGYGTEVRSADSGPQKPTPMSYPLRRQYVDSPGQKLSAQVFQVNGNENDPFGGGGTCFGDSGGPSTLGGQLVGVTSYGYTSNCRYLDGYQRLDIGAAHEWLKTFGIVY